MFVIGIDLAGKESNPTGMCVMNDDISVETVYRIEEIIERVQGYRIDETMVAIDAPLFRGDVVRIRKVDRLLKKYGTMAPTLEGMRQLVRRASIIVRELEEYDIIEVFPTASAKILGIYDRNYKTVAERMGMEVANKHELDAYLCALTGKLFLEGKAIKVGDKEGMIVIPIKE